MACSAIRAFIHSQARSLMHTHALPYASTAPPGSGRGNHPMPVPMSGKSSMGFRRAALPVSIATSPDNFLDVLPASSFRVFFLSFIPYLVPCPYSVIPISIIFYTFFRLPLSILRTLPRLGGNGKTATRASNVFRGTLPCRVISAGRVRQNPSGPGPPPYSSDDRCVLLTSRVAL